MTDPCTLLYFLCLVQSWSKFDLIYHFTMSEIDLNDSLQFIFIPDLIIFLPQF